MIMKKKLTSLALVILLGAVHGLSQTTPPQQPAAPAPAPKKIIIQTPFGPKEVDAPAEAPPQQTNPVAAPGVPNPATPQQVPANPVATPEVPNPTAPPPSTAAQPSPSTPQAPQVSDDIVPISLQFDNATDIYGLIKIIMGTLNLNYIIDPAVKGSINIYTAGNLRRSDLLPILETILKINGATMVRNGNFYEIVPAASAAKQPLEVQERGPETNPDDQMVLQIIRMKYVAASEMANLLNPFLSGDGANIVVHNAGNVLMIVERRSNLRKLLEIVDLFDTNVFQDERVRLLQVKNNLARDVVADLSSVFAGYGLSNTTAIRFVPIERLNSILVMTPNATVFPEVERWLERLDQNTFKSGIQNYVYHVKNAKASDIQGILSQLYGGATQLSTIYNQPSPNAPMAPSAPQPVPQSTGPPVGTPGQNPAAGTIPAAPNAAVAPNTGFVRSSDVRIIADAVNNQLVIQANPQLIREILETIQELDVLPRQVLVDAQIYEVVLDSSLQFGLTAALQNRGTLSNPQTTASFAGVPPSFTATTFTFVGRTRELVAFLNAAENRSRVRTLSAPSVLVSDNQTADFQVGAEIPVPTATVASDVQVGGNTQFAQTIQFRNTGVLLHVKPQINDSGNVTLDVSQEVSQAGGNTTSSLAAPMIAKSSVNTSIAIQDGQTIAIGGFIRDNQDYAQSRVPLLGRIPVVGALFGSTQRSSGRTELIVLITPHVLRTHDDADTATEELKAKLKEVQKLLK
jgi:general secretion pathway protein D